jgi:membrane protein DedA with SNARE-associated domain
MTSLLDRLLNLHGAVVYLIVGLVVLAEDALFFGFVIPGETAAVLGGVAASRGNVSLAWMCIVVVAAAILGDTVGYEVGSRFGNRLLRGKILQRRADQVEAARDRLARRGGTAVFFGRFVAFFRAMMPFLAGTARMPYRRFLSFNAAGGAVWGVGTVLIGYLAADSYAAVERTVGRVAAIVVAALVLIAVAVWHFRRRHKQKEEAASPPPAQRVPDEEHEIH